MGPGAVYSFSKFFPGKMTETCQETDFESPPCPEELADVMYTPDGGDERSLFGHTLASSENNLFISAPKSSTYSRQSGVIYVYGK
jgi:hypothetical protein